MQKPVTTALDRAPSLIWLADADGQAIHFNRSWIAFTGRPMQDQLGDGWRKGVHPDDLETLDAEARAITARQRFSTEYRLRRHDGAWRWMLDTGEPMTSDDGALEGYIGTCIDITDRKEIEEALQLERQRLELAQESAGVGVYDWDISANKITWSAEMFKLHGIDPQTPKEAIYGEWLARIHPDDRSHANETTQQFLEKADRLQIEFRILHPEKGLRWILGRGRMIRDSGGLPTRMIGINLDVTEQRHAEQALRESEQRFRDVAENFPGVIYRRVTYPDGRIEYPFFSGAVAKLLPNVGAPPPSGWKLDDLLKYIHFGDTAEMLAKFRSAQENLKPLDLEGRVIAGDGTYRWIQSYSSPREREDGALVWDGVLLDVTEHHHQKGERERAAAMLLMGTEVAGIGTWEYNPSDNTVVGSQVTNVLFGLGGTQPRPLDEYMSAVHPEDSDWLRSTLMEAGAERHGVTREYRILRPDGAVRWVSSKGAFVKLADGSERVIGAMFDITVRKHAEQERAAALKKQQQLLKELDHRIKNNLQIISSVLQLQALDAPEGEGVGELRKAMHRVHAIGELHSHLSYESGSGTVDFGACLQQMVFGLEALAATGAAVEIACDALSCLLHVDIAVPLGLAVNELAAIELQYAVGSSEKGRLLITLRCDDKAIVVRISSPRGNSRTPGPTDAQGGLGLRITEALCRQIGATLEQENGGGFLVTLSAETS